GDRPAGGRFTGGCGARFGPGGGAAGAARGADEISRPTDAGLGRKIMASTLLRVDGEVERPLDFSFDDLAHVSPHEQVRDVSRFHPSRKGDGVTLNAVLERVQPKTAATYLTLHASADNFAASVPLAAIREEGIVVYALDGGPLPQKNGGPIRFL